MLVRAWSVANVLVFLGLCVVDGLAGVKGDVQSLTFIKGVALPEPSLLHVPCRLSPLSLLRGAVTLLPLSTAAMLGRPAGVFDGGAISCPPAYCLAHVSATPSPGRSSGFRKLLDCPAAGCVFEGVISCIFSSMSVLHVVMQLSLPAFTTLLG